MNSVKDCNAKPDVLAGLSFVAERPKLPAQAI
jgi:hypothetical protein